MNAPLTTEHRPNLPKDIYGAVETIWLDRAARQNMPGPQSQTYLKAEVEFFVGAMAMAEALGYNLSPAWVMKLMSGRNIVEVKK